jgi:hypothetical protein
VQTDKVYATCTRLQLFVSDLVTGLFDSLDLPHPSYDKVEAVVHGASLYHGFCHQKRRPFGDY